MDRTSLDRLQRQELIELARSRGVERPEVMTRDELIDEILRLSVSDPTEVKSVRGWFGVARDLLAGLVEQGLHLPDAAKVIRGEGQGTSPSGRRPLATVTLAEIYAAQGHLRRGIVVLQEVLEKEPEHEVARRLLSDLEARKSGEGAEDFPEESFAWSDVGPATPAESPSALEARASDPQPANQQHADNGPLVSFVDSPEVVLPADVDLSRKADVELEAPTLRTTQLRDELSPSDPPASPSADSVSPTEAGTLDSDPEPEENTSPNASEQVVEEPTLGIIPREIVEVASAPELESEPGPAPESGPESESDNIGDLESPDSCVLFLEEKRVVVSWRVAQASFARQLEERPEGAPVVRLVWWVPGLPAARHSQDVAVTQAAGELLVEPKSFVPEATLRGALGWAQASGEFVVMATAVVCCLGSEHAVKASELREELTFRPHAAAPPASKERASAARQLMERYA